MENNVFISYKRDGGSSWAEVVRMGLLLYGQTKDGKFCNENIKMDVHSNSQDWRKEIVRHIKKCVNIVVIIHKGFERSLHADEDIWLEEIKLAIHYKRAIIPFFVDGLIVDEDLDKIFDTDERLALLKMICHNNQQIRYTHGLCEGSIIALTKAFKDKNYILRKIRFTSIQCCHVIAQNETPYKINESNHYDYPMNYSYDSPITIEIIHEASGTKLKYHLCFEEFADEKFKHCAQIEQSPLEYYKLLKDKPYSVNNDNDVLEYYFINWQEITTTIHASSFNPLANAISSMSSYKAI